MDIKAHYSKLNSYQQLNEVYKLTFHYFCQAQPQPQFHFSWGLSWLYFQLIQPTTQPPNHPTNHPDEYGF